MEQEKGHPTEPTSMEHWEEALEESLAESTPHRGELREGIILGRTQDGGLVVDIGAKRDGYVPKEDLDQVVGQEFEVGKAVPVIVNKFHDGNVELSVAQALLQEDWLKAEELMKAETVYETTVLEANRGGLTVAFGRLRGFVPMSQLIGFARVRQPAERQRRLEAKVNKPIMLKVLEVNRKRRRLILSEMAAAKEWRAARRSTLMTELEAGQVRRGRISQITDFGLFVNLGGLDGLVHVSELSWGRIENPNEVYRVGQRIKVKVLSIDRNRQRIALSIKALKPDPWETTPERYQIGQLVEGKVSQIVDFGIFIEIEPGVEGLLHNSELSDVEQREELEPGKRVLVKVIRIEPERRRIGLSVRQVRREEWEAWVTQPITAAAPVVEEDDDLGEDDDFEGDFEGETTENVAVVDDVAPVVDTQPVVDAQPVADAQEEASADAE